MGGGIRLEETDGRHVQTVEESGTGMRQVGRGGRLGGVQDVQFGVVTVELL